MIAACAFALLVLRPASLATPYWWDAGAVYVPGAQWLVEHGFQAMPGTFPSDLGRGHTPGFYLALALVFRVFGTSPTSGHALVFATSTATLALTYALGTFWLGRVRAIFATALLACSPLFLTMSSEALPEIPITALTIGALYAFARERFVASAVVCTVLVLCKEVGVACPLAIVGASAYVAWRSEGTARRRWVRAAAWQAIPLVALAVFFGWQRIAEGWFVLPYHAGLWSEHHDVVHQLRRVVGSPTVVDGRWIAIVTAIGFAVWARVTKVSAPKPEGGAPIGLAMGLLVAANLVFFAKMFFLERYILPIHPVVVLALAWAITPTNARTRAIAAAGVLAACTVGVLSRWDGVGFDSGETTFRYLHAVRVHQRVLGDLPPDTKVFTSWPMTDELRHPYLGYVSKPIETSSLENYEATGTRPKMDAVIVFETLGNAPRLRDMALSRGFHLKRREEEGGAVMELWQP